MRLHDGLELTSTGALRRMASAHGLPVDDGTTRAELLERLGERLSDADYLSDQLRGLSEAQRALLVDARASNGELRGLLVERDHPAEAENLVDRGLLFRVFTAAGPRRGEVFSAPEELLALLPEPPAVEPPPPGVSAPPERRSTDAGFSLFCLASALARHADLEAEVRSWSVEPGGWEWDGRWNFLRHVATAAGLLVHQPDGALVAGPTLARALNDPPAAADRLWRAYLRDRAWSDLGLALGRDDAPELVDGVSLRAALVEALEALEGGAWLPLDALSNWLERTNPTLVREHLTPRGLLAFDGVAWSALERPLLRAVVLGPLYWLGRTSASVDGALLARRGVARGAAERCRWHTGDGAGRDDGGAAPAEGDFDFAVDARGGGGRGERAGGGLDADAPGAGGFGDEPGLGFGEGPARGFDDRPPRDGGDDVVAQRGGDDAAAERGGDDAAAQRGGEDAVAQRGGEPLAMARDSSAAAGHTEVPGSARAERPVAARAELFAPARAELGTLFEAERYLLLRERGRVSRYELLQAHVAASLASGGSLADCQRLLGRLSQAPLPSLIADRLAAWGSRLGAVQVRPAVLLDARSAEDLDAALEDERVRRFVRARLSATVAEVPAADALELAAVLRQSGQLPQVDAALRLSADPRRAYAGLIDQQVLEWLLVALLAFRDARPEQLAELEGSSSLLERLEHQFPPERLRELRAAAARLAGDLRTSAPPTRRRSGARSRSGAAGRRGTR